MVTQTNCNSDLSLEVFRSPSFAILIKWKFWKCHKITYGSQIQAYGRSIWTYLKPWWQKMYRSRSRSSFSYLFVFRAFNVKFTSHPHCPAGFLRKREGAFFFFFFFPHMFQLQNLVASRVLVSSVRIDFRYLYNVDRSKRLHSEIETSLRFFLRTLTYYRPKG